MSCVDAECRLSRLRLGMNVRTGRNPSFWRPLVLVVLAVGCRDGPVPAYVRVEGSAPRVSGAPEERALLVAFWATWCPPCKEETPGLVRLAARPPEGVAVVVVSQDRDMQTVEAFLEGPPDPRLNFRLDPGEKVARAFGATQLPVSFLVRQGRLIARFDGPQKWDGKPMRRLLERLVDEPQPAVEPR